MKVWVFGCIWGDGNENVLRVFSSEEKMWDEVLKWFREEDDWTLEEVKERVLNCPDAYVACVREIE